MASQTRFVSDHPAGMFSSSMTTIKRWLGLSTHLKQKYLTTKIDTALIKQAGSEQRMHTVPSTETPAFKKQTLDLGKQYSSLTYFVLQYFHRNI